MSTAPALAQGVNARTGVTLFAGGKILNSTTIFLERQDARRDLDVVRNVTSFSYALTQNLLVGGTIPVVSKHLSVAGPEGRSALNSFGLGDLILLVKYRFLKFDAYRSTTQFSLFAGPELPTGFTDEKKNGKKLPPALQPGLGSVNGIFALAASAVRGKFQSSASVFYKVNTEGAQDFQAGDLFVFDLTAAYRVYQGEYPRPELGIGLGMTGEFTQRDEVDGKGRANTGGNALFLSLPVFFRPIPQIDLTGVVQVPLAEDFTGDQPGFEPRFLVSLTYQFY